ncbi:hypothetical protein SPRG_15495 [Saprolegnia parasitica CBS 223.65]|uniref:Uncharacterized protein n=1 Tax=Saprolegnia parasitica (strain CBS 223.65) TaxID=695850 RepID=A0A067BRI6_SAPPC|nr:hypothetical protein SPRG_15495 [Saprolegnia parasitica CBS 223.65]KDO19415.1 hypothetical protein SPRG_15495 [Saprolegnia parasitica CBS 223.65]|eukprot:XP_012209882.1 hypothetical protein SPRG_15495 [Saprolegnia parasitica CBS 223.65]
MSSTCRYSYKECPHPRSTKKDGSPHALCEFHRKKANAIQRTYASRRRREIRAFKQRQNAELAELVALDPIPYSPTSDVTMDDVDLAVLDAFVFEDPINIDAWLDERNFESFSDTLTCEDIDSMWTFL